MSIIRGIFCILALLLLCSPNAGAADIFSELSGAAARKRTAEARKQRDAYRQQTADLQKKIAEAANELQASKKNIDENRAYLISWKNSFLQSVKAELVDSDSSRQRQEALLSSLQSQLKDAKQLEEAFDAFSKGTLDVAAKGQAALKIGKLVDHSELGLWTWLKAFKQLEGQLPKQQVKILDDLERSKGEAGVKEAAVESVESAVTDFINECNTETILRASAVINEITSSLELQVQSVQSLLGHTKDVQHAYSQIIDILKKGS